MVNSYGTKKLLKLLWILCLFGALVLTAIYYIWMESLDNTYFQLLATLLLGYVPYTMLEKYVDEKFRPLFLFINVMIVFVLITVFLPYRTYFLVIFLPLLATLFNNRKIFYASCLASLIFHYIINFILKSFESVSTFESVIEITYVLCYYIILDLVIKMSIKQSKTMYVFDKTVKALILAVEAKDDYTRGHSIRVSDYALLIGQEMKNNGFNIDVDTLRISSLIHDIGKINIDHNILTKEGKLTVEEYNHIKLHSQYGADIAKDMEYPDYIIKDVLYHHERYDGKGYPECLTGTNIPINARIIALADTFDALTSNRPYRKAFSVDEAYSIILENMGTQFDPKLKDIFIDVFPELVRYYIENKPTDNQNSTNRVIKTS
ncbi:HD-GYP domain-containing protein [Bacillus sp. HMF5848]|uniref:HD-GYP domain-containing protein n=1 Tax=Bacillus sp. HMF5848 TaxID=2495421 RepID=UPI000F7AC19E|nr:HD-GYP domain-containing protein [Bacillus sp. HMF5848]RSK26129.1 HD-GYP domain-containing protein [Bacillus sp. HMF5848]